MVGHRDLSPDKNYNGIVDPWERTKECPCFEVKAEADVYKRQILYNLPDLAGLILIASGDLL